MPVADDRLEESELWRPLRVAVLSGEDVTPEGTRRVGGEGGAGPEPGEGRGDEVGETDADEREEMEVRVVSAGVERLGVASWVLSGGGGSGVQRGSMRRATARLSWCPNRRRRGTPSP